MKAMLERDSNSENTRPCTKVEDRGSPHPNERRDPDAVVASHVRSWRWGVICIQLARVWDQPELTRICAVTL